MSKIINVLHNFDDSIANYATTMMNSICKNLNDEYKVRFFILTNGPISCDYDIIKDMYPDKVDDIIIDDVSDELSRRIDPPYLVTHEHQAWTSATFIPLLIPFYFSRWNSEHPDKYVDTIIHTDIDMCVNDSLSNAIEYHELSNKMVSGVRELMRTQAATSENGIHTQIDNYNYVENYVNAGFTIWSLDKIDYKWYEDKLSSIVESGQLSKYRYCDQDVFNYIFYGNTGFLPHKWNFYCCIKPGWISTKSWRKRLSRRNELDEVYEVVNDLSKASCIHYVIAKSRKPWNKKRKDACAGYDIFDSYKLGGTDV